MFPPRWFSQRLHFSLLLRMALPSRAADVQPQCRQLSTSPHVPSSSFHTLLSAKTSSHDPKMVHPHTPKPGCQVPSLSNATTSESGGSVPWSVERFKEHWEKVLEKHRVPEPMWSVRWIVEHVMHGGGRGRGLDAMQGGDDQLMHSGGRNLDHVTQRRSQMKVRIQPTSHDDFAT